MRKLFYERTNGRVWDLSRTKIFYVGYGLIGNAKYVVSYHDGVKIHNGGSPFFDVRVLNNKKELDTFIKELKNDGYIEKLNIFSNKKDNRESV